MANLRMIDVNFVREPKIGLLLGVLGAILVYTCYRRYTRISVSHVPGPEPESFILGNLPEIFQSQAGVPDFKYQRQFGGVVRIKGLFGEDRLLISDPKALQYIFHTSGYGFLKWSERTEISRVLMGRGLLWADGDIHKRQRKVMLPGFGAPESKAFIPIFQKVGGELTAQWTDILASSPGQTAEFNVASWLSRATMDSIGEAAFDYQFGALSQSDNQFMKAYFGLMSDTLGSPPKSSIFMQTILPVWVLQLMSKVSRRRSLVHARHTAKLANEVARALVKSKTGALLQGRNNKDILSLLVKANASEDEATKLTEEEMLAQMRTILLAGHETSATSLCWVLLELARHPELQDRLRAEIRATEFASGRKYSSFTSSDLDGMEYLSAILKAMHTDVSLQESMRFHPALYQNYRQAAKDDVLPLSTPTRTTSGEYLNNLPIPKGMKVILSIAAYHRNKDVFGEDADIFNPDRWFRKANEKKGPTLGVYGNLLTFAGGIRACIGWRFALYEMQSLTVEIISNFELCPTPQLERLRREACLVMLPTLEGEELKGENLPLGVKLVQN
ncbi:Leukotriene-B4 omega-hydroxylase 3 [Termitomyces sp. J132]|nr:Leukotriene-B4 omega-hydroxylase 3 [Termitomyces sp. J132]